MRPVVVLSLLVRLDLSLLSKEEEEDTLADPLSPDDFRCLMQCL